MKHALVKFKDQHCDSNCLRHDKHADGHPVAEMLMIEDEDALQGYADLLENAAEQQVVKCLRSPLFPDKVDHMLGAQDMGSQLLAVAYYEARAHSFTHPKPHILNNPLYRIGGAALKKIALLRRVLNDGEIPLINPAGGFMWLMPDQHEILETYDKKPDSGAPAPFMRKGNKVVVLENDWEIPKESRDYLTRTTDGWTNYSVIRGLRSYDYRQLVALLKQFKTDGGETVFVYTTGLDVPQMFEYTDATIEAGLEKLTLYVVGGTTDQHDEYFNRYRSAIKIEVLDTLA